jgi:hypothetical protein
MQLWLVLALVTSWMMTGIIWFVQWVHYPLFDRVGRAGFAHYEQTHTRRTFQVLLLPLGLEALSGAILLAGFTAEVLKCPSLMAVLGLQGIIYGLTFFVQMPLHRILEQGFSEKAYHWLVRSNWPRTVCWTAKSLLLTHYLFNL